MPSATFLLQTFYRDVLGHDRFRLVFKRWNAEEFFIALPDARRRRQDSRYGSFRHFLGPFLTHFSAR